MADPITMLTIAAAFFVGTHFAMSHPLRAAMVRLLGNRGFLAVYSLVSLAALFWMIAAFKVAPPGTPVMGAFGAVLWVIASLLTLIAMVLLAGSLGGNPALPETPQAKIAAAVPTGVFRVTRHPMMWAFALWAISHILLFWSARTIIVALAILVLALVGSHFQDRKKAALLGDSWKSWQRQTSYWPRFSELGQAGLINWLIGIALWLAATWAHMPFGGVPAGLWRWF